ncbi:hypothetical protein JHK85_045218 [Glycine max]|nr:hypothetical protein JHK85_045218 [Glycine max]
MPQKETEKQQHPVVQSEINPKVNIGEVNTCKSSKWKEMGSSACLAGSASIEKEGAVAQKGETPDILNGVVIPPIGPNMLEHGPTTDLGSPNHTPPFPLHTSTFPIHTLHTPPFPPHTQHTSPIPIHTPISTPTSPHTPNFSPPSHVTPIMPSVSHKRPNDCHAPGPEQHNQSGPSNHILPNSSIQYPGSPPHLLAEKEKGWKVYVRSRGCNKKRACSVKKHITQDVENPCNLSGEMQAAKDLGHPHMVINNTNQGMEKISGLPTPGEEKHADHTHEASSQWELAKILGVGLSGSGKSTLLNLLLRLYEPSSGQIYIDGFPLNELDIRWLREHIGYVAQEPHLFHMDIKSNIKYGCPTNIKQADIERAAKKANAHDFISSLPNGYETLVDDNALSGGQKQRIAIARAILRDPVIMILDEATSALDSESEHYIKEVLYALKDESKTRTIIIIAHRGGKNRPPSGTGSGGKFLVPSVFRGGSEGGYEIRGRDKTRRYQTIRHGGGRLTRWKIKGCANCKQFVLEPEATSHNDKIHGSNVVSDVVNGVEAISVVA